MAGWHHRLDGRESERTPGVGDGQGGLVCCGPWGRKQLDMTELLNSEKAMATHSSTLVWKIPWMEEPGRLQSVGS